MGSGLLLALLVVLWFVVLVPMVVTRGDEKAQLAADTSTTSGRTLQRRRGGGPVGHASTERVDIDRTALRESGELRVDVHAARRRVLAALVGVAVLTLLAALLVSPWLWSVQLLLDVVVAGYLCVLRAAARREQATARRAARAAARRAARPPSMFSEMAPTVAAPLPRAAPAPEPAGLQHPSVPIGTVHPLRPSRVVGGRTGAPAGWQHSAVVGLDDDDIGFAYVDEYEPRRVANA